MKDYGVACGLEVLMAALRGREGEAAYGGGDGRERDDGEKEVGLKSKEREKMWLGLIIQRVWTAHN